MIKIFQHFDYQFKRDYSGISIRINLAVWILITLILSVVQGASAGSIWANYKLIANLPDTTDVEARYKISSDGARVVYLSDQGAAGIIELFSVPAIGGAPIKLNSPLVADGYVNWFSLNPDGGYVVYMADQEIYGKSELYRVPIGGGQAIKVNGPLDEDKSVWDYKISPDGSRVLYSLQENIPSVGIYSVPIGGGAPVQLLDRYVYEYVTTPDGSQVVFSAFSLSGGIIELSRIPIEGGSPASPIFALPESWTTFEFDVSPDGARVVYVAEPGSSAYEIYSVPIEGGSPVKLGESLSPSPPDAGPNGAPGSLASCIEKDGFCRFQISPDSSRVVYWADQQVNDVFELFSVPITGGIPVRLNGPLVSGGDVDLFSLSPLGDRVVYLADQQTDGVMELFSVPITGGTPVKLNTTLASGGNVLGFQISPDGMQVAYYGEQDASGITELYQAPIGGGAPIKLNRALVTGGDVSGVHNNRLTGASCTAPTRISTAKSNCLAPASANLESSCPLSGTDGCVCSVAQKS